MQESSISEKIKELRTDLKMNQKNFSAAIGIRQSTLSSYENGVVTPSNDVLLTIAQKFHVSLDWLFGLSENKVQISTLSDIIWVLLQMNESNELRYELDINNKFPGDIETETQKWYAGLRFYGNDPEHSLNADMCNFLAQVKICLICGRNRRWNTTLPNPSPIKKLKNWILRHESVNEMNF